MNVYTFNGRLTKDPTSFNTKNGDAGAGFTVAVEDPFARDGETVFMQVSCFGKVAENVLTYMDKGARVGVTGRVVTNSYEKNGVTINTFKVMANQVEFLETKHEAERRRSASQQQPQQQSQQQQPQTYGSQQQGGQFHQGNTNSDNNSTDDVGDIF